MVYGFKQTWFVDKSQKMKTEMNKSKLEGALFLTSSINTALKSGTITIESVFAKNIWMNLRFVIIQDQCLNRLGLI